MLKVTKSQYLMRFGNTFETYRGGHHNHFFRRERIDVHGKKIRSNPLQLGTGTLSRNLKLYFEWFLVNFF